MKILLVVDAQEPARKEDENSQAAKTAWLATNAVRMYLRDMVNSAER